MRRLLLLAVTGTLIAPTADAQGVAPGGPIYNSTGIGSGWGNVPGGTGPSFPNGTVAPPTRPAIPPGGLPPVGRIDTTPSLSPPPPVTAIRPSPYPKPLDPYPIPASHRRLVPDPEVGKNATNRGKDEGMVPASTL